jgi:hypothetical protein
MPGPSRFRSVVLWVVAVCAVNATWAMVVDGEAVRELNGPQQAFDTEVEIPLDGFLGAQGPMPAVLSVDFTHLSDPSESVGAALLTASGVEVWRWNGTAADAAVQWEGVLEPGRYVLRSSGPDLIEAEASLTLTPLRPVRLEGHLLATIGLVVLAFVDAAVRRRLDRRGHSPSEAVPVGFREVTPLSDEALLEPAGAWQEPLRG